MLQDYIKNFPFTDHYCRLPMMKVSVVRCKMVVFQQELGVKYNHFETILSVLKIS